MSYVTQCFYPSTGISTLLAAAYESRSFVLGKLFMPVASFAGDTSQTLTDGTINIDDSSTTQPNYATAILASQASVSVPSPPGTVGSAKPIIVKIVDRDPLSAEIRGGATVSPYRLFTADGTDVTYDSSNSDGKYAINRVTGEIYVHSLAPNFYVHNGIQWLTTKKGPNAVVGLIEFKPLEGAALNTAQQEAADLSAVIQSLSNILRAQGDLNKGLLNVIR